MELEVDGHEARKGGLAHLIVYHRDMPKLQVKQKEGNWTCEFCSVETHITREKCRICGRGREFNDWEHFKRDTWSVLTDFNCCLLVLIGGLMQGFWSAWAGFMQFLFQDVGIDRKVAGRVAAVSKFWGVLGFRSL